MAQDLTDVPSPPRTPSERAQKHLLGFQGGRRVMLLIGATFLVMGGLATSLTIGGVVADLSVALSGETTQGTIKAVETTDERIQVRPLFFGATVEDAVQLDFAYTADGQERSARVLAFDQSLLKLQPGATVTVEYSTWSPDTARVEGTSLNLNGWLSWLMPVFALIGLLIVPVTLLDWWSSRRVYASGEAIMAEVTDYGRSDSASSGGKALIRVKYRFKVDGKEYEGFFSHQDPELMKQFDHDTIAVLYDPEAPTTNLPWME